VNGSGDGIRWYDGDPTATTGLPTGTGTGWVNFAPPLTAASGGVSIDTLTPELYYLVGAQAIVPFKDRLLFFAPWIQWSANLYAGGSPIQLPDTVIWSWNGTPYYSSLTPVDETSNVSAYYVDQTGKGGYLSAGINQVIKTVVPNEDVLIVGFTNRQTRLVYTSNDISPFLFYTVNSEFGSSSTFSGITVDRGAYAWGIFGVTLTTQLSSERIDLDIPDSIFEVQSLNNGISRINSVRDFYREWLYFSYPVVDSAWKFPTQSFLYNYRENSWSILYENFTAQGLYYSKANFTWATCPFKTWSQWREPWNAGSLSANFPDVIGGNPQGYVLIKGEGTGEGVCGTILSIANSNGSVQITSPDHCLSAANLFTGVGDYVLFQGALGTVTATITGITQALQAVVTATNTFSAGQTVFISQVQGMTQINGKYVVIVSATASSFTINLDTTAYTAYSSSGIATISPLAMQIGQVVQTPSANVFIVDIPFSTISGQGYIGQGQFSKLSQPLLQTRQFPFYWNEGRQVRLAAQKYLLDSTAASQVTLNVYLSQDPNDAWNNPVTQGDPTDSVVYSQILYTCPESTNIGLSASNTNLQMPTAPEQYQIWHRYNTSLIGDTFQVGITLSDTQMRNLTYATDEITLHGMHFVVQKGPHLA
jgi:hypothetical protein